MRLFKSFILILLFNFSLQANTTNPSNLIQIAILLDTSNSMDGLIDQAKAQLWNIANEITKAEKDRSTIRFQIALYEYGNDNIPVYQNHVKQIIPFTEDMDMLSEKLFALRTRGGEEYCGQVIHQSILELEWNPDAGMRAIYIAGNESFAQGNYPYGIACSEANKQQIFINTIFCGPSDQGRELQWSAGAYLTNGNYNNIDQNVETIHRDTPYDRDLSDLNLRLNDTYISYTKEGKARKESQIKQDSNASGYGRANYVKRTIFKSKANYRHETWDLVDAYEAGKDVYTHRSNLPLEFRDLSEDDLKERIQKMKTERFSIQKSIGELSEKREAYLEEMRRSHPDEVNPFEQSIISSLKEQLCKSGFQI